MAVSQQKNAFVSGTSAAIGLSQVFTAAAAANNPAYLVLTALDRDEHAAGATGATGSLSGNGQVAGFSNIGGDGRGAGIVFTYLAPTGRYYNGTYGYLDQLTYNTSASAGDVTNLSMFASNDLAQATAYAGNPYAMMQVDPSGYLGSATFVTQPGYAATVPAQATPGSVAAAAGGFVGRAWNGSGCWVLASTIAAEAGASLPVQSTAIGLPGKANGEWFVAYNGPAGQSGNWQSMVTAGEVVLFGTPGGGGHVTTCVSGAGGTAMLVDNITYVNANGQVQNAANDGSATDVTVAAPHAAAPEWAGVAASSVVIYQLDTPVVTAAVASDNLSCGASQSLAPLFSVADPAGRAVVDWQVYDTAASNALLLDGVAGGAGHSAATALTASSLAAVTLRAGATPITDTLDVRAFNGSYWGDWQSLAVSVSGSATTAPPVATPAAPPVAAPAPPPPPPAVAPVSAPPVAPAPPVVAARTANQTWTGGSSILLALPTATFHDPRGQALTLTARQSNGQALPSWLRFNAATDTFTGLAPAAGQTLGIKVTATDTSGLAASETFNATIQAAAPVPRPSITVSAPTPNQVWTDGHAVDLVLPSATFTDALGLKMSFAAYEVAGPDVTSWLHFNPATETFFGNQPASASGTVKLEVIATDAARVSAADMFSVTFAPAPQHQAAAGASHLSAVPTQHDAPPQVTGFLALHN